MIDKIKYEFENKYIGILGFGREGKSTLNYIINNVNKARVVILDQNDVELKEYEILISKTNNNIELSKITGKNYMSFMPDFDVIIKSPGVSLKDMDITNILPKITSQTNLFLKYFKNKVIGVTGTKGKSTTSTLIYEILKTKYNVSLIGNIGVPCFEELKNINIKDYFVFELSAHQLEFTKYSPHISVFLNIYEEHLDYYNTFSNYLRAKQNIYLNQDKDDIYIFNKEQKEILNGENIIISKCIEIESNIKNDKFTFENCEITTLIGRHNFYNMNTAIKVASVLEVDNKEILTALQNFKSLPHRLECFKIENGIKYIDDSISTIPEATISAVNSIEKVGTLLIGGMDRNIDYTPLVEYIKEVDENKHDAKILNVIFMYESGKRIYNELQNIKLNNIKIYYIETLDEAVKLCKQINVKDFACVLSPAAASYGFFKNFEERGDKFKNLINI